jgi:hypothetical protein
MLTWQPRLAAVQATILAYRLSPAVGGAWACRFWFIAPASATGRQLQWSVGVFTAAGSDLQETPHQTANGKDDTVGGTSSSDADCVCW